MNNTYDIAVVGLGPAGSVLSKVLAENGLNVLSLEKKVHPRIKPCAGCVSKRIERILDLNALGIVEGEIRGATLSYLGKNTTTQYTDEPVAYMVHRERLDLELARAAESAGAHVCQNVSVRRVVRRNGVFDVRTTAGDFSARFVAGADGALSVVRRCLIPKNKAWDYVSLERKIEDGQAARSMGDRVHIDLGWVPFGYGWVFPHVNTLSTGLAVLRRRKGQLKDHFRDFLFHMNLDRGESYPKTPTHAHALVSFIGKKQTLSVPGALLLGDAAGLTDPLTGEGIYFAIYSAQLAAEAVMGHLEGRPGSLEAYERRIEREIYSEFRHAAWATRWIYRFPRYFVRKVQRYPEIFEAFFKILRGEGSYEYVATELRRRLLRKVWPWLN